MARWLHTGPGSPIHAQSVHIQFSGGLRGQGGICYKRAPSRMGVGYWLVVVLVTSSGKGPEAAPGETEERSHCCWA